MPPFRHRMRFVTHNSAVYLHSYDKTINELGQVCDLKSLEPPEVDISGFEYVSSWTQVGGLLYVSVWDKIFICRSGKIICAIVSGRNMSDMFIMSNRILAVDWYGAVYQFN
jgi:hypothetical protein